MSSSGSNRNLEETVKMSHSHKYFRAAAVVVVVGVFVLEGVVVVGSMSDWYDEEKQAWRRRSQLAVAAMKC